jgi:hypothetical protein
MKHAPTRNEESRFRPAVRHYHRAGGRPNRTWDEWIDGEAKARAGRKWLRIILVVIAVLGLLGIIAGLLIELY